MGSVSPSVYTSENSYESTPPQGDASEWYHESQFEQAPVEYKYETEEEILLREKELYQAPAPFRISLLANSIYYRLGFTAIIKREDCFQLLTCQFGGKRIIVNRNFPAPENARDYVFQEFIRNASGYLGKSEPVWTQFYIPEKQWLEKKIDLDTLIDQK